MLAALLSRCNPSAFLNLTKSNTREFVKFTMNLGYFAISRSLFSVYKNVSYPIMTNNKCGVAMQHRLLLAEIILSYFIITVKIFNL